MTDGSESDDNRFEEVGSFTTSDGLRLRSAISGGGDRPALVLVHGWTQDLRTWDRVVHELHAAGETGRILRYDHRGHGGSDAAPLGAATLGRAADDLAELLTDRVPDGLVVLAGHSMGGMTLMALAERHPDLVAQRMRGVAFMGTASDDMTELTLGIGGRAGRAVARAEQVLARYAARLGHRAPVDRTGDARTAPNRRPADPRARARATMLSPVVRALVFGRHADREDVASVAEQALAADPATVAAFRTSIAEHRRRRALEVLRGTPAVVLVGGRDRLCPPHHARAITAELPGAELALYPGAGHMITFGRAPEVAAHLRGLLAAADSGPRTTSSSLGPPTPRPHRRRRTSPSCTTEATRAPSARKSRPLASPRPPPACGDSCT